MVKKSIKKERRKILAQTQEKCLQRNDALKAHTRDILSKDTQFIAIAKITEATVNEQFVIALLEAYASHKTGNVEKIPEGDVHIPNKWKRQELVGRQYREKKKVKRETRKQRQEARARGEEVDVPVTTTIEMMREADVTMLPPEGDDEVKADERMDEFRHTFPTPPPTSEVLPPPAAATVLSTPSTVATSVEGEEEEEEEERESVEPKIMLTTSMAYPSERSYGLIKELVEVVPGLQYFRKKHFPITKICDFANNRGFTAVVVLSEDRKHEPSSLHITSLPEGPTSYWRLTSLELGADMKHGATCNPDDRPELLLNGFGTRLGHRVGRQIGSLFGAIQPDFKGRRVVAFHNQRDFVFFRHYRYVFRDLESTDKDDRCALQEIGPRFTLKLRSLQLGLFAKRTGEYEYVWRPDSQVSRKVFAL
ncbi:IMP4 U3 small nucleolar ribonucleoprotein, putative [Perkinsus marinus ATCC 50983]|uniref:IMP4 U3 small nucleolar ribonucleoprotein, putative n=1 Tax=Perkinsus marinus (strain ATCC 50983 / TXsc) TaxID=423536 RepID=C5LU33_PERM5|nr:IMP4 U3 small nucleolar ribonucleoprotein, putative [Perkinsus marinus ATCC 50983]EEQ99831.1 IMP4 U3 small nucleolar ribonucleoprotein, putative [Perkinsus marinus ATCC 50983]|eukprot:XP_002767114.1 IMP4 U3 small nucleolar ribonucleoprotein, putative [Perkinsus marinus ATCC 50983]